MNTIPDLQQFANDAYRLAENATQLGHWLSQLRILIEDWERSDDPSTRFCAQEVREILS